MNRSIPAIVVKVSAACVVLFLAAAMVLEWRRPALLTAHPVAVNLLSAFISFCAAIVFASWVLRWYRQAELREAAVKDLATDWVSKHAAVLEAADRAGVAYVAVAASDLSGPMVVFTTRHKGAAFGELGQFRRSVEEFLDHVSGMVEARGFLNDAIRAEIAQIRSDLDSMTEDSDEDARKIVFALEPLLWSSLRADFLSHLSRVRRAERRKAATAERKAEENPGVVPRTVIPAAVVRHAVFLATGSFIGAMYLDATYPDWLGSHPVTTNLLSAFVCFNVAIVVLEWGFQRWAGK